MKILVSGFLIRKHVAGLAWHYGQYLVGLQRLGHDVLYVEHTVLANWLNPGAGVFAFSGADEADRCIESVVNDYDRHCREARRAAEEYFAAPRVLASLIESLSATAARHSA